jgi:hypothetical protein
MKFADFGAYLKKVDPELARKSNLSKLEIDSLNVSRIPLSFGRFRFVLSMSETLGEIESVEIYGGQSYNVKVEEKSKVYSLAEVAQKYEVDLKVFGAESQGRICNLYARPRLFVGGELEEATANVASAQNELIYALEEFDKKRLEMLDNHQAILNHQAVTRALAKPKKIPGRTRKSRTDGYKTIIATPLGEMNEQDYIIMLAEKAKDLHGRIRGWKSIAEEDNETFKNNRDGATLQSMYHIWNSNGMPMTLVQTSL